MQSYLELLEDVVLNGEGHDDRTGVGTKSVFGRQWRHSMSDGFPLLTTKKVPLRWVFEELRWFLSGSTDVKDLQAEGVTIWDEWATQEKCEKFDRHEGDLGPIYGALWRQFPNGEFEGCQNVSSSTDQIAGVLDTIENNPASRRIICSGWHPYFQSQVALPPCHTVWQIKCHGDDRMSLHLYARSIDIFLGLPFNIASYALLLSMLCAVTGRKSKDLIISFGDLHLYKNHFGQASTQMSRLAYDLPKVELECPGGNTAMERLLAFRWKHVKLTDYDYHPKIEAPVAI